MGQHVRNKLSGVQNLEAVDVAEFSSFTFVSNGTSIGLVYIIMRNKNVRGQACSLFRLHYFSLKLLGL